MARQDALNIYINDETKDQLAETYGQVIEAVQKGAISEQIKNKNLPKFCVKFLNFK